MKGKKQIDNSSMSLGQQRRLEKKREVERAKRNALLGKVISYSLIVLISAGLVGAFSYSIYRNATKIKASSDYSTYLTDDGLIKDVTANELVELTDYKNITAPLSEIEYTDESVEKDIKSLLEEHKELSKETDAAIKDGDKVNIDYVGSVDGVEFNGGNTNGEGADLEIGSNSYVDDFETQLIGHKIGDKVTVNVTFPADYSSADLAGKDAVFEVVINGIYVTPEFTDEFVKENLSENASTAAEYKEYLKKTNYDKNLDTWLEKYLLDNTTVKSYPAKYFKHLKSIKKYEDQMSVEYMNNLYSSMGYNQTTTFEEYVGMTEAKYDAKLDDAIKDRAKKTLLYQAIYEKEGLSASKDDYAAYFDEDSTGGYDAQVEQQGVGYVMQQIIDKKVLEYVKDLVTVK
ncbi:FKBP-type peptidyl-prolyl cis-trans isomerase [Anaerocolumna sp. AGMB13020]|uniref:trigger factor n=1 Tax=Anaerocolumna sp. AGMB13020 TaxID=3081750 RepID=UPI00295446D4|nr:FKBP-type peptidyl-prolyl cis-trans isomerase [Anaerocolumna sp. AGMB13020]WOO37825.1 FKBP-type peptidyl-prolyl cis-trans isomerase [Anaerocolumna sp. AGMB13020]